MWFKNGFIVGLGLGAILVCLAHRVDAVEPQPIKIHDRLVIIVTETFQSNAKLESGHQPSGAPRTKNETVTYRVSGMVVDELPGGMLLIEARQSILDDNGLWKYTLTGKIRREDILPDRTVRSQQISDLSIAKVWHDKPRDSSNWARFARWCRSVNPLQDARSVEAPQ